MMSPIETYVGQLVTAGVPGEVAEVIEVFDEGKHDDPTQDTTTPRPRTLWCRILGAQTGVFESRELRPALITLGMEFVRRDGAIAPRAVVLRHNSSDKDPVEVAIGQRPSTRLLRREFLQGWRALQIASEAHG